MNQLCTDLKDFIETLESLQAQHSDSQNLLDSAENIWGSEDVRYLMLRHKTLGSVRFDEPNRDAKPEEPIEDESPNELIDWLPVCINELRSLMPAADDKALLTAAEQKWKSQSSFGYLAIKAGEHQ